MTPLPVESSRVCVNMAGAFALGASAGPGDTMPLVVPAQATSGTPPSSALANALQTWGCVPLLRQFWPASGVGPHPKGGACGCFLHKHPPCGLRPSRAQVQCQRPALECGPCLAAP
jgi:hypothetical protein